MWGRIDLTSRHRQLRYLIFLLGPLSYSMDVRSGAGPALLLPMFPLLLLPKSEAYKDYVKTRHKTARLASCETPLGNLITFLRRLGLGVAPNLRQLWFKTKFHLVSKDIAASAQAFQVLLNDGFVEHVEEVGEEGVAALELWTTTMIHEPWLDYLNTPTDSSDIDGQVLRLTEDAEKLHALMSGCCAHSSDVVQRVLRPVCEDISSITTLIQAWSADDLHAGTVETAVQRMKGKRMAAFGKLLPKSDIGKELLSKTAFMLQASGQDMAAQGKLDSARQLLADRRLPVVELTEGRPTIANRDMVNTMVVVEVMVEALDLLEQAIELWSRPTLCRKSEEIQGCFASLLGLVRLVDECIALELLSIIAKSGVDRLIHDGPEDPHMWDSADVAPKFWDLGRTLVAYCIDDAPLSTFLERFTKAIRMMPKEVYIKDEIDVVMRQLEPLCGNMTARHQLEEVLRLMSDVLCDPAMTHTDFFEEVEKCQTPMAIARSRLSKAVKLQAEVDALASHAFIMEFLDGEFHFDQDFGEGVAPLNVAGSQAQEMLNDLPKMIVLPILEHLVMDCLKRVFGAIADATFIRALRVPTVALSGAAPVDALLDSCVKPSADLAKKKRCTLVEVRPRRGSLVQQWPHDARLRDSADAWLSRQGCGCCALVH